METAGIKKEKTRRAAVLAVLLLSLSPVGCATSNYTMDRVHEVGVLAREIGMPAYDDLCSKKSKKCKKEGDKECRELTMCIKSFQYFTSALKLLQRAVLSYKELAE